MGILYIIFGIFLVLIILSLLAKLFFPSEIRAAQERDPAAKSVVQIILLYSGFHAIIGYKLSHLFWKWKIPFFPRAISQLTKFFTGIEIHPGAQIGKGLFIDHGMGVVIGETTIMGDNVTLFQGVTLGGTGKETGKRHPTLGNNIVVGAGAKVLGNILIGDNSYIGANAVVIKDVPSNSTVVGVPGRITRQDGKRIDTLLDHVHVLDPVIQQMEDLQKKIQDLEDKIKSK